MDRKKLTEMHGNKDNNGDLNIKILNEMIRPQTQREKAGSRKMTRLILLAIAFILVPTSALSVSNSIAAAYGQLQMQLQLQPYIQYMQYMPHASPPREGPPYDNTGDIEVIRVDGILENKTDLDNVHSINIGVEKETLLPLCNDSNYYYKTDILGTECFNYDENYVMYFTPGELDPNEWMEMREERKKKIGR